MELWLQNILVWLIKWVGWISGGIFSAICVVFLIKYILGRLWPSEKEKKSWSIKKKNDDD